MSILKVEVGAPITLEVAKMEEVEGQFGPQLKFTAPNGDCVFVSKDAGHRQLERIGITDDPTGAVLLFEKVQKGAKTYLNINPAAKRSGNGGNGVREDRKPTAPGGAAGRAGESRPPHSPSPSPRQAVKDALDLEEVEFSDPLYTSIVRFVLNEVDPLYHSWTGQRLPADAVVASVATLYIQAKRG